MKDMLKKMLQVQNVNIFVFVCFVNLSCSSVKKPISKNQINVLNTILNSSKYSIYYKTIINNGTNLRKPIEEYITKNLEFQFCDFNFVNESEILLLKKEFKKQKVENLYKLPLIYKNKLTKNKILYEASFISLPILFRNNTMAVYYNTQTYGGNLTLLQKKNSEWKIICSSSVWIE